MSGARYELGDRVEFTIDGETIAGEVRAVDPPSQARYAVRGDDGQVRSLWEHGIRPAEAPPQ